MQELWAAAESQTTKNNYIKINENCIKGTLCFIPIFAKEKQPKKL
jgi:hypothetical protein